MIACWVEFGLWHCAAFAGILGWIDVLLQLFIADAGQSLHFGVDPVLGPHRILNIGVGRDFQTHGFRALKIDAVAKTMIERSNHIHPA